MRLLTIVLFLAAALIGCTTDATIVDRIDIGKAISADMPTNPWNEVKRTRVVCERATVMLVGGRTVITGAPCQIVEYSDGQKYLFVEGMRRGLLLLESLSPGD